MSTQNDDGHHHNECPAAYDLSIECRCAELSKTRADRIRSELARELDESPDDPPPDPGTVEPPYPYERWETIDEV